MQELPLCAPEIWANKIMSRTFVPHYVRQHGLEEYFRFILMSSEIGIRKPSAEIFRIAAQRLGILPGECAYVGDIISRDVRGIRNAGIKIDNPGVAYKERHTLEKAMMWIAILKISAKFQKSFECIMPCSVNRNNLRKRLQHTEI